MAASRAHQTGAATGRRPTSIYGGPAGPSKGTDAEARTSDMVTVNPVAAVRAAGTADGRAPDVRPRHPSESTPPGNGDVSVSAGRPHSKSDPEEPANAPTAAQPSSRDRGLVARVKQIARLEGPDVFAPTQLRRGSYAQEQRRRAHGKTRFGSGLTVAVMPILAIFLGVLAYDDAQKAPIVTTTILGAQDLPASKIRVASVGAGGRVLPLPLRPSDPESECKTALRQVAATAGATPVTEVDVPVCYSPDGSDGVTEVVVMVPMSALQPPALPTEALDASDVGALYPSSVHVATLDLGDGRSHAVTATVACVNDDTLTDVGVGVAGGYGGPADRVVWPGTGATNGESTPIPGAIRPCVFANDGAMVTLSARSVTSTDDSVASGVRWSVLDNVQTVGTDTSDEVGRRVYAQWDPTGGGSRDPKVTDAPASIRRTLVQSLQTRGDLRPAHGSAQQPAVPTSLYQHVLSTSLHELNSAGRNASLPPLLGFGNSPQPRCHAISPLVSALQYAPPYELSPDDAEWAGLPVTDPTTGDPDPNYNTPQWAAPLYVELALSWLAPTRSDTDPDANVLFGFISYILDCCDGGIVPNAALPGPERDLQSLCGDGADCDIDFEARVDAEAAEAGGPGVTRYAFEQTKSPRVWLGSQGPGAHVCFTVRLASSELAVHETVRPGGRGLLAILGSAGGYFSVIVALSGKAAWLFRKLTGRP